MPALSSMRSIGRSVCALRNPKNREIHLDHLFRNPRYYAEMPNNPSETFLVESTRLRQLPFSYVLCLRILCLFQGLTNCLVDFVLCCFHADAQGVLDGEGAGAAVGDDDDAIDAEQRAAAVALVG